LTASLAGLLSLSACLPGFGKKPRATVLFDEGHKQQFLVETRKPLDLSGLAALFQEQGVAVKTTREGITDNTLSGVDALVVSGPFAPFTSAEIDATTRFLTRGGRLCVMLHIPPPMADLLHQLNVDVSNGVIHERENVIGDDPLNFHITTLAAHPLTENVQAFDAFGVWALQSTGDNAASIAQTGPQAWVDLNGNRALDGGDAVQSFGVVVAGQFGKGRFVLFGDDAIFQNQFLTGGNAVLGKNLARWLAQPGPTEAGRQQVVEGLPAERPGTLTDRAS
jgi:hypothetical protein